VLLTKKRSVRWRVTVVLAITAGLTLFGVLLPAGGAARGWWGWPEPSSWYGVLLGIIGGVIVLFEMLLTPRKRFRGAKVFPAALWSPKWWLRAHVVLGLVCYPIIMIHAGYGFGGPISRITLILFLLTIASGVWGLVLQQWLPRKLLDEIPEETVASQIDAVTGTYVGRLRGSGDHRYRDHTGKAYVLVESLIREPAEVGELPAGAAMTAEREGGAVTQVEALVTGLPAKELETFLAQILAPYLEKGVASGSPLVTPAESERRFARLREAVPVEAQANIDELEALADLRRQLDTQARVNWLLHSWVPVHLFLSTAMTGFMLVHAVRALKYW